MQTFSIKKKCFNDFVNEGITNYNFAAPVVSKQQNLMSKSFFKLIDQAEEIYLEKKTYHTAKSFFFSPEETLFEFNQNKIINPSLELKETIYFGLRRCDLNGIMHQDTVFLEENIDPFYKKRRDKSILIGYHCKEGDDYCFCNSLELKDFFDLMFYDKGDFYAVEVGSDKGQKLIDKFSKFFDKEENIITDDDKKIINNKTLNTTDIKDNYHSDDWTKGSDKCLACGACNFLCMNCHCFSIEDDVNFDLKTGKRIRKPASCQLRHFTRVAGDHIFRDSKLARFKHRIYHQIQYFKERHDVVFCTGCGRCIEGCPAKIDWVNIINEMKK